MGRVEGLEGQVSLKGLYKLPFKDSEADRLYLSRLTEVTANLMSKPRWQVFSWGGMPWDDNLAGQVPGSIVDRKRLGSEKGLTKSGKAKRGQTALVVIAVATRFEDCRKTQASLLEKRACCYCDKDDSNYRRAGSSAYQTSPCASSGRSLSKCKAGVSAVLIQLSRFYNLHVTASCSIPS